MDLLTAWHEASTSGLGAVDVWDAHTHTGANDPDGVVGTADRLLDGLDRAGHRGAVVMTSREPAGYRVANDRILEEAGASDGRLLPFCRVDPRVGDGAVDELRRCRDRGFVGLKLHPRGENFSLALPVVDELVSVAASAGMPVLVHAGRGIPRLGDDVERLLTAHPEANLIMAHAGISDLGQLTSHAADHPGLFFDLAWWSTASLLAVAARVRPSRLMYASDTPYGSPQMAGAVGSRVVRGSGYTFEAVTAVMGGNVRSLLAGARPVLARDDTAEPTGQPDALMWAAYADLQAAIAQILAGGSGEEALQLAARACRVDPDHPHADVLRAVGLTIDIADTATPDRVTAIRSLIVAASALLTPDVPVPVL